MAKSPVKSGIITNKNKLKESMKEKVKDLDPVLIGLIKRFLPDMVHAVMECGISLLDEPAKKYVSQLESIDWRQCSNEERLKYAELVFTKGVSFKTFAKENPAPNIVCGISPHLDAVGRILIRAQQGLEINERYIYSDGKFAEIISRPDEKEETKEPEFQPGEMVEVRSCRLG